MPTNLEAAVRYKTHWEEGDEEGLVEVISEDYTFEICNPDQTTLIILRWKFPQFLQEFKADVGLNSDGKLMKIVGVIIGEEINGILVLTCYWETLGHKTIRGTGQILAKNGKIIKEVVSIF